MNERIQGYCSDVAIIGLSGRFPGASTVQLFWRNLCEGVESVSVVNQEAKSASVDPNRSSDRAWGNGPRDGVDFFDASFFGFSPREADITDPQHRIFLECAWEALESAGYDPESYPGSIGVFGGVGPAWYGRRLYSDLALLKDVGETQVMIGNEDHFLATQVSYRLNLRGPSVVVQSACSTSLVAIHFACQSVLSGECDIALAGGMALPLLALSFGEWASSSSDNGGIIASDGHCRAFDAGARGTVPGNGGGIVAVKRLDAAVRDGDFIHAVIKASAINNDGARKPYYTAPSVAGQASVIAEAIAMASIPPDTITYVEAHGTGTPIGDPIEIQALTDAFKARTDKKQYCAIGSVKTNIGHLDAAAGVVGLIKVVLALQSKRIPPILNFRRPNPEIDFASTPFYVNEKLADWKEAAVPRRAGVNAFGFGGTNAHVIVEEAPLRPPVKETRSCNLWLLSARSERALDQLTTNLDRHLRDHPEIDLSDAAYTLQVGRRAFKYRRALVSRDHSETVTALQQLKGQPSIPTFVNPPSVRFLFPGQGAQYVNMGLGLYQNVAKFRTEVDRCSELLIPYLGLDLRSLLFPSSENVEQTQSRLNQTAFTQPALFVIEYSLAQLWIEWGIQPAAMLGNSIGEYVAACVAGVFSLEDALKLVSARGQLIQNQMPGAMLAVPFGKEQAERFLGREISLGLVSGASACVLSGSRDRIHQIMNELADRGVEARLLATSHAFHSYMMDGALAEFYAKIASVKLNRPRIPYISNVTGTWITAEEAINPSYWVRHLRHTVQLADGISELLRTPDVICLEVGPGNTLGSLVERSKGATSRPYVLSSIRHPRQNVPDEQVILGCVGKAWVAGASVDWRRFHRNEKRYRLPLPTYPFERESYWIEPSAPGRRTGELAFPDAGKDAGTSSSDIPNQTRGTSVSHPGNGHPANGRQSGNDSASQSELRVVSGHPRPPLATPFVPPGNMIEEKVCKIWETLLGIREVGIHDDFFDLGGQSLTAIQLVSRLRDAFSVDVPVDAIFNSPTVGSISKVIEERKATVKAAAPPPISRIPRAASRLRPPLKSSTEKIGAAR